MQRRRFGWRWNESAFDGADRSRHNVTIAECPVWTGAAGRAFASKLVRRKLNEIASPYHSDVDRSVVTHDCALERRRKENGRT
jgi:hypothetical protein